VSSNNLPFHAANPYFTPQLLSPTTDVDLFSLYSDTIGDHFIAVTADFQVCIEDGTVLQIVRQRTLAATAALTLT